MEMCYDGALVMPSSYAMMNEEEMTYVDGGKVNTVYGYAEDLAAMAGALMASWSSLILGYSYGAAASVASGIGVGVGVLAGLGVGYCTFAANEYRQAFVHFSQLYEFTHCSMSNISYCGILVGVSWA